MPLSPIDSENPASTPPMANYPWVETVPGRYEQDFGTLERCYGNIAGPPPNAFRPRQWNVVSRVKLCYRGSWEDLEKKLRHAWTALRSVYPTLAAREENRHKVYEVPTSEMLDQWMLESFIVHRHTNADTILRNLTLNYGVVLHSFPMTSELLLHGSHLQIDGLGELMLWDRLFNMVLKPIEPKFGTEWKLLPPCQDDLLNWPSLSQITPEQNESARQLRTRTEVPDPICLPIQDYKATPLDTFRVASTLSPKTTSAVIKACRQQGLTVTVAWHACVLLAVQKIQFQDTGKMRTTIVTGNVPDTRRRFPAGPVSDYARTYPVSCNHGGLFDKIIVDGFSDCVSRLKPLYAQIHSVNTQTVATYRDFTENLTQSFEDNSTPQMSSPGFLDRYFEKSYGDGEIEIEDAWIMVTMLSAQVGTFLWAWNERMTMSANANRAFHNEAGLERYLRTTKELLLEALEVEETTEP